MLEIIYYVIIAVMAVLLFVNILKKRDLPELICIAAVLGALLTTVLTTLDSYGLSMPLLQQSMFIK